MVVLQVLPPPPPLVLVLVAVAALAPALSHAQSPPTPPSDFISIDCGLDGNAGYTDPKTGIAYVPDAAYTSTGVSKTVSSDYRDKFGRQFNVVRSFPNGTRNCYTLSPVTPGARYLVRASFVYGNYDGLNSPLEFDLHIGANLWQTVTDSSNTIKEIMTVAPADDMEVCLVNTGNGTPFISVLELRPLAPSMYPMVNESQSLVLYAGPRLNYGGQPDVRIRYPDDPYDREWVTAVNSIGWTPVSAAGAGDVVRPESERAFLVPSAVLRTAVTTPPLLVGGAAALPSPFTSDINFTVDGIADKKIHVLLHFAEVQTLVENTTRAIDVYLDGSPAIEGFVPDYLQARSVYTPRPLSEGKKAAEFCLRAAWNSTLGPLLNALERHYVQLLSLLPTDHSDVNAMRSIKKLYGVKKNWEGDPCSPKQLVWEGLNCSGVSDPSINPRIISLDLSSSGLKGGIAASLANLTALEKLDLSNNNLTGEVPEFLSTLPALRVLTLANNELSGSVPETLDRKSKDGSLTLRVDGNPGLPYDAGEDGTNGTIIVEPRKKNIAPIIAAASASIAVVLLIILVLVWWYRKRGVPDHNDANGEQQGRGNRVLTFSDIQAITRNFTDVIGRGGYGTVYRGCLDETQDVAVKMLSRLTPHGKKQFLAEAKVLTTVHHKKLVSLLAYCEEENNLALVYEYMPNGSLDKHLSGDKVDGLSWKMRLNIALDVSQGLNYLHTMCRRPIIHRDIKPANILLDQNMGARLADFGLSRIFEDENATHASTDVAGTLGYLDPEYHRSWRLNEKSDVYSFGVVLLQLITGRAPISDGVEKVHIGDWVRLVAETGNVLGVADPGMKGGCHWGSLRGMVQIALSCTSMDSTQRPDMERVVRELNACLSSETERCYSGGVDDGGASGSFEAPAGASTFFPAAAAR